MGGQMCDVFLFRDLGLFELAVRGRVCGADDAEVIALVVRHLPERSAIVVGTTTIGGPYSPTDPLPFEQRRLTRGGVHPQRHWAAS